jgi:hypothetical protein
VFDEEDIRNQEARLKTVQLDQVDAIRRISNTRSDLKAHHAALVKLWKRSKRLEEEPGGHYVKQRIQTLKDAVADTLRKTEQYKRNKDNNGEDSKDIEAAEPI